MTARTSKTWKLKYVSWYQIIESVFGASVPHLTNDQIEKMIFETDWMIIPLIGELSKKDAMNALRPNLYIDLSDTNDIYFGIVYENLDSVDSLRNILLPYNEKERNELIAKLSTLDDSFKTTVNRKLKPKHFSQSPTYERVFEVKSKLMTLTHFREAFRAVDSVLAERALLDKRKTYQLAPTVSLLQGRMPQDEREFTIALQEIKPIYEMTVKMKTEEQVQVCHNCLCFTCLPKLADCVCPCLSYPKPLGKVIECHKKDTPVQ